MFKRGRLEILRCDVMPVIEVNTTAVLLIEHHPRRKFISFTNIDDSHFIFLSDEAKPTQLDAKWIVCPSGTLIITREMGFPERAFYAVSDGQAKVAIGFQNEEKKK